MQEVPSAIIETAPVGALTKHADKQYNVKAARDLMIERTQFGSRLRKARLNEGFATVEALARFLRERYELTISPRTLRRYEQGSHTPTCEILAALICALPSDCATFYTESFIREKDDAERLGRTLNNVE